MIHYKMFNQLIAGIMTLVVCASCNNTPKTDGTTLSLWPLTQNEENPSTIVLQLTERTEGDTTISFVAKGLYKQDTVGFILDVSKNIPAGINEDGSINEKDGFKKGSFTFKSTGTESDHFITALAGLWKVDSLSKMRTTPIQPLTFSSNKKPIDFTKT